MAVELKYNPIEPLLESGNPSLVYFARRDLLHKRVPAANTLWDLPAAVKILGKQQEDGSWRYRGRITEPSMRPGYEQLETFRQLGVLIEKFGFTRDHAAIGRAAEFLLSFQSRKGDIRGIYGNQYTTTYTPAIVELLLKAGYDESDSRVDKCLAWLIASRQDDGGWAIPVRTAGINIFEVDSLEETVEPDRRKPFSQLPTGMALRALAMNKKYKRTTEVQDAAKLLMSRFFKKDDYPDRNTVQYWLSFSFPYWFTDLLTSLDSLSRLGFSASESQIAEAITWFKERQSPDGTFSEVRLLRNKDKELHLWVTLQVARVFNRFRN
ncbi:MAG: prenyltransferase/squalene oxidase repeat-containing protein [Candidatus Geothermincolia bacterium]